MPRQQANRRGVAAVDETPHYAVAPLLPGQPRNDAVRAFGDQQVLAETAGLADEIGVEVGDDEIVRFGSASLLRRPDRRIAGRRVQQRLRLEIARLDPARPGAPEPVPAGADDGLVAEAE